MLAIMALMLTGCRKHEESTFNFNARIEQVDNGDAKTQLVGEKWIYWVEWDAISINSNTSGSSAPKEGILLNHGSENYPEYNGVFQSTLEWNSEYFCALYPHRANNVITHSDDPSVTTFETVQIDLPATQKYANDTSFDHDVMPMVAWYGGTPTGEPYTSPNLDFHSLGCIVRLHIYNTKQPKTLESVTISSNGRDNKQLKGMFNVVNYNTFDPHLVSASNAEEDRTITITMPTGGTTFDNNTLLTFYLVLPATQGIDQSTSYQLTLTINTSDNMHCSRNFTVPVRRNGITNMQALGVTNWTSNGSELGLSGVGDEARPYKIYSYNDLNYVRKAFNKETPKINNKEVTADTWFTLMTSSIELDEYNWDEYGIKNFKGHMTFSGTNNTNPGITNNSIYPLFEKITEDGTVEGITVKCNVSNYRPANYSPLCITNEGNIIGCHVVSSGSNGLSMDVGQTGGGLAGICVTNEATGVIQGCGCTAKMACTAQRVAGICLINYGQIKECFASSPMEVTAAYRASGICDSNANNLTGAIEDCYFAARITNTSIPWSGIASVNTGNIRHCYASETALIISSSKAAGIVGTNHVGGNVDYCWCESSLRAPIVSLIAGTVKGGKLMNCFCNNGLTLMTLAASASTHYAGGFAARIDGGTIENCFIHMSHTNLMDNTGTAGGFVGIANGGTIKNCYVFETYSPTHLFYGAEGDDDNTTFQYCHLVSGTQSGVSTVYPSTLETMQALLNSHLADGDKTWQGASNSTATPPSLEPYTLSKKRNKL